MKCELNPGEFISAVLKAQEIKEQHKEYELYVAQMEQENYDALPFYIWIRIHY